MKRYIYGMSVSRGYLIGKLEGYADVIQEHILKIISAQQNNNIKYTDKWIGDISRAIYNVSKYTIGNKNQRLSADMYKKYLFDSKFGTDQYDMQCLLEDFQEDYPEYADFTIDTQAVNSLNYIVRDMENIVPAMIAEHTDKEGIPIPRIHNTLRNIFRKYIDFSSGADNWR